jgi:TRAP-type C4-dicarboxylate transport system permease small subunit
MTGAELAASSAIAASLPAGSGLVPGWRGWLLRAERCTTQVATVSAAAMLVLAVVAGLWQVTVRFIFSAPSEWTEVLTRFALIWMVHLGVALAVRQGAMVSIDLLHRSLRGRWRLALEVFVVACTLVLMGVLVWQGGQVAWRIRFQEVAGLSISMSWAYLAIPVGALFSTLAVLAHFFDPRRTELDTAV